LKRLENQPLNSPTVGEVRRQFGFVMVLWLCVMWVGLGWVGVHKAMGDLRTDHFKLKTGDPSLTLKYKQAEKISSTSQRKIKQTRPCLALALSLSFVSFSPPLGLTLPHPYTINLNSLYPHPFPAPHLPIHDAPAHSHPDTRLPLHHPWCPQHTPRRTHHQPIHTPTL